MNFRILIGPRGRDRGLGTEATRLFINYLFSHTTLKTLTLSVFDFNPRAKRVYEKVGFIVESIDENELEIEGEWFDSVNMKLDERRLVERKQLAGRKKTIVFSYNQTDHFPQSQK